MKKNKDIKNSKAKYIKPGMVIGIKFGDFTEYSLIVAKRGFTDIEYTHFMYGDAYTGLLVGTINRKEKIQIITGQKRKEIIDNILNDVFKLRKEANQYVDTIRLIQAMEK